MANNVFEDLGLPDAAGKKTKVKLAVARQKLLGVGSHILWPGKATLCGIVIAIDFDPREPVAWIRRVDDIGDLHYHYAKVKDLEFDDR